MIESAGDEADVVPITIESETDFVRSGIEESRTAKVMGKVPVTEGLPEMVPDCAARVSPEGSLPEVIDHM